MYIRFCINEEESIMSFAFYSEESAIENGFSKCPLLHNPDQYVNVTDVFENKDYGLNLGLKFVGEIDRRSFGKLHSHVLGRNRCRRCDTLLAPNLFHSFESDLTDGPRKIVKAKRMNERSMPIQPNLDGS